MAKPRFRALLLLAIAGGAAWWGLAPEKLGTSSGVDMAKRAASASARSTAKPVDAARIVHFWSEPAVTQSVEAAVTDPVALSAEAGAAIAEQAALQALGAEADLELSPRQWAALAAVIADIQAVRQAYEASLAIVTQVSPGRYRMEIPAYPAAGDALRTKFHAELRANLGSAADEIIAALGAKLEGRFAGFGVSVQTLEFTAAQAGAARSDYRVTRTVQFWNSVEGGERLTTRRETHFPGLEDPSGYTWGPLLTVLAARVGPRVGG